MKLFFLFISIIIFTNSYSQSSPIKDSVLKTVTNLQEEEEDPRIFNKAEKNPEFPGGEKGWAEFLKKQMDSVSLINGAAPGTYKVIIRFVVSKNGTVRDIVAETKYGYNMEAQAVMIIKKSPKWIPAEQNGHTVNFYLRQPITFVVDSK